MSNEVEMGVGASYTRAAIVHLRKNHELIERLIDHVVACSERLNASEKTAIVDALDDCAFKLFNAVEFGIEEEPR